MFLNTQNLLKQFVELFSIFWKQNILTPQSISNVKQWFSHLPKTRNFVKLCYNNSVF